MTDFVAKAREVKSRLTQVLDSYIDGTNSSSTPVQPYIRQILIDAKTSGYSIWEPHDNKVACPFMLQRCIRDEKRNRLYFVDIAFWDLSREYQQHEKKWGVSISPSVQFHCGERRGPSARTVDVSIFTVKEEKLTDIEKFFSDFYEKMGCVPYEVLDGSD